jgi:hypothetical protein
MTFDPEKAWPESRPDANGFRPRDLTRNPLVDAINRLAAAIEKQSGLPSEKSKDTAERLARYRGNEV